MRLCVFCGSQTGKHALAASTAMALGRELAGRGIGVVTGGGRLGLMGVIADAVLEAGGSAIGVIPHLLTGAEIAHQGLTRLEIVGSMHERKARMAELSEGFLILPGGFGTMEEFFEVLTWSQLKIHRKPIGLLNLHGFYDPLLRWIDHAIAEGFIKAQNRSLIKVSAAWQELIDQVIAATQMVLPPAAAAAQEAAERELSPLVE